MTDGFIEYNNAAGEEFGAARVQAVVRAHRRRQPAEIIAELRSAVRAFAGGRAAVGRSHGSDRKKSSRSGIVRRLLMSMNITIRENNGVTVIDLAGRLTLGDAPAILRDEIRRLLEEGKTRLAPESRRSDLSGQLRHGATGARLCDRNPLGRTTETVEPDQPCQGPPHHHQAMHRFRNLRRRGVCRCQLRRQRPAKLRWKRGRAGGVAQPAARSVCLQCRPHATTKYFGSVLGSDASIRSRDSQCPAGDA